MKSRMKLTVDLPVEIVDAVKQHAREEGRFYEDVYTELLRLGFDADSEAEPTPRDSAMNLNPSAVFERLER